MSSGAPSPEERFQAVQDAEEALAAGTPPAFRGMSAYEARRRALADADTAKMWAGRGRPANDAWIVQAAGAMALSILFAVWMGRLTPLPWYGAGALGVAGGLVLAAFVRWRGRKRRVDTTLYDAMVALYGTAEPADILLLCAKYEKLYTSLYNARKNQKDCAQ